MLVACIIGSSASVAITLQNDLRWLVDHFLVLNGRVLDLHECSAGPDAVETNTTDGTEFSQREFKSQPLSESVIIHRMNVM